jgi:ADP-heptose:LPS heptosyltransferase
VKVGQLTVVEWHHMGDAVMALPFVRGALAAGWGVSICATPGTAEVFRLFYPDLDVAVFDPRSHAWWKGGEWTGWRERVGSDTAVCAWADPRVHFWMKQAGFSRRVGLPADPVNHYAREAAFLNPRLAETVWLSRQMDCWLGPLLTDSWTRPHRSAHHQDNWVALAGCLGFEIEVAKSEFALPGVLKKGEASQPLWIIHPGGRLAWKHWTVSRWEELLQRLSLRTEMRTILVQGPEIPRLERLPERQEVFHAAGLAEFAGLLQRAEGMVGLDSFPAHLAAALGLKTVLLFGDMPEYWFCPRGKGVRLVKTPAAERDLQAYRKKEISLLHAVTVDQVVDQMG